MTAALEGGEWSAERLYKEGRKGEKKEGKRKKGRRKEKERKEGDHL